MTSTNHANNLPLVTLHFPPSTPPSSSAASPSSPSSNGWTDKITKKIKELKSELESLKKLKEAKNGYLPEQDSKSLDSLPTQVASLETVHKLAEFADQLDTNKHNATNILTNLCTGLEKFLGFNRDSKGYDGSGIVYADLDRLCDGVMGFLSGVLEAVKNENEVTTYDNYITGDDKKLKSVLDTLNTNIGFGREGLAASVGAVKGWLEGYESVFRDMAFNVTNDLALLNADISGKYINNISAAQNIQKQLDNWNDVIKNIDSHLNHTEKTHVNILDISLKNSITHELKRIQSTVHMLKEAAENKFFGEEVRQVDEDLLKHRSKIKDTLQIEFENIRRSVTYLEDIMKDKIKYITECLKDAHAFLNKDFEVKYKGRIWEHISEIQTEVNKVYNNLYSKKSELIQLVSTMQGILEMLSDSFEWSIKHGVQGDLQVLRGNILRLTDNVSRKADHRNLVGGQLSQLEAHKKILDNVIGSSGTVEDGNIEALFAAKIKHNLSGLIGDVYKRIGKLYEKFDSGKGNGKKIHDIIFHIKGKVDKILEGDKPAEKKGLTGIETAVKEYASGFDNKSTFGTKVQQWVTDILQIRSIKLLIDAYVHTNQQNGYFKQNQLTATEKIVNHIKSVVNSEITAVVAKVPAVYHTQDDSIVENLKKIKHFIDSFASQLETHIGASGFKYSIIVDKIVKKCEDDSEVIESKAKKNDKGLLTSVIPRIFKRLLESARNKAADFVWFVGDDKKIGNDSSIAKEIDEAKKKSNSLLAELVQAFHTSTMTMLPEGNVDKAIETLKTEVDKLDTTFTNQVKKDLPTTVNKFHENAVKQIQDGTKKAIKDAAKKVQEAHDILNRDDEFADTILGPKIMALREHIDKLHLYIRKDGQGGRIDDKITEIQKELENLAYVEQKNGFIDAHKHTTEKLMNLLKNDLQEKFSYMEFSLTSASEALNAGIKGLRITISRALETSQLTVQDAFDKLTMEVRILFAEQKRADLAALKSLVETQITEIEKIIRVDKYSGVKGLLQKLRGNVKSMNSRGGENKLDVLKTAVTTPTQVGPKPEDHATKFRTLFHNFMDYSNHISEYIERQMEERLGEMPPPRHDGNLDRLISVNNSFNNLLQHLKKIGPFRTHIFNHNFVTLLANLQSALNAVAPAKFAEASPLLNVVKAGVQAFHGELAKQYVSRYSGNWFTDKVVKDKPSSETKTAKSPPNTADNTEITEYGRKCAKVFLTCLATLSNDFFKLIRKCTKEWFGKRINTYEEHEFGKWFENQGYVVNYEKDKQHGELQDRIQMNGTKIYDAFLNNNTGASIEIDTLASWKKDMIERDNATNKNPGQINLVDVLQFLYGQTNTYYEVCHLSHIERPKSPSNIYQMLVWLTGLPHNRVFPKVSVGDIGQLFEKPDEKTNDAVDGEIPLVGDDADSLDAHPEIITASNLSTNLRDVCTYAEDVLIAILGHGHADGIYAVDFNTNPDGFSYPTAPGACFDMLSDILSRLYQQLYFVYKQCSNDESSAGWLNCWYGQGVGGSSFNCNTKQCANQICNQRANQKANQIHEQSDDQHPNCGLKSPLQSFLEDGLPGFLPHQFDKVGCRLTCTVSNHRGITCKTPMGFSYISVTASHTQNGAYLKKVLKAFCGTESSPLTKLCAQLTCLLQKPPQTLGDIFAFYYCYLDNASSEFYGIRSKQPYTRQPFNDAVTAANFGNQYEALNPTILVSSNKHDNKHLRGDLCSIATCTSGSDKPCGMYVKSLTTNIYGYYSTDHKANHLSWIVYITETFYDLLKKLYDECCAKCDKRGTRCNDKRCVETCPIKYTNDKGEPTTPSKDDHHKTNCKSIITCRNTHPTLYKYGFTFGNPWALSGAGNTNMTKRTCKDFCEALKLMLGGNSVLIDLRKQIDQFLWDIRTNFSITVLALWLLSLLYLLHIMVIRLDLLHIKSHLHSPSSHRIAAQSLLAAGRVNKLGRVFYLQP